MLAVLSLVWGASFLFIKVAVRELSPATLILGRLVGGQPHGKVLGALAVVGMALCYAVGQLLAGRHLRHVRPLVVSLAATGISAIVALPAGIAQAPHHAPSWKAIGAVAALGVP